MKKFISVIMIFAATGLALNLLGQKPVKYIRFEMQGKVQYGVLEGNQVKVIDGDIFGDWKLTTKSIALDKVKLLAPCKPSKVIAMAFNYASHTVDRDRPTVPLAFAKLPTCIIGQGDTIRQPKGSVNLHYEGELVVVFKKETKRVTKEQVKDHIMGVTIGNDISERDWQKLETQWFRAKASDTFGPLGPCLVSGLNYNNLKIETRLNGVTVQSQSTSDMFFDVEECVSYLSNYITFMPGDVLFLGTPGVTKKMNQGDVVEVEIEGIGILRNYVGRDR